MLALNRSGIDYALCGGIAVGVHGVPRSTTDIDVVIRSEPDLAAADIMLSKDGWFAPGSRIEFPDGFVLHRRMIGIGGKAIVLDLLVQPPGEDFLADRFLSELQGAAGWIIGRKSLVRMKRMAGRPKDLWDLDQLGESPS